MWASALPGRLKPVAALLADIANADGTRIYPSVAYIAWSVGDNDCAQEAPNQRTVQRVIDELLKAKVLVFVGWNRAGRTIAGSDKRKPAGPGATAEYRLDELRLPTRRPWAARYGEAESTDVEKGDNLSPSPETGAVKVTNETAKGDSGYGDNLTPKGDNALGDTVSPNPDPSLDPNPSKNPAHARDGGQQEIIHLEDLPPLGPPPPGYNPEQMFDDIMAKRQARNTAKAKQSRGAVPARS